MKFLLGLIIVAALCIMLSPFAGPVVGVVYGSFAWLGHVLATGPLSDGRAAFRAGVLLGGTVAVAAFARVAWLDRGQRHALGYALTAGILALSFFMLFFISGLASTPYAADETASAGEDAAAEPAQMPWFQSRRDYERGMQQKLYEMLRAAARGNQKQADVHLAEMSAWSQSRERYSENPAESARLLQAYNALVQTLPGNARLRRTQPAQTPVLSAEGVLRIDEELSALLEQMWALSPQRPSIGLRLLSADLRRLAMPAREGSEGEAAEQQLAGIHARQEMLFAYLPHEPRLYQAYANTMVDQDEELALGAMTMSALLEHRRMRSISAGFDPDLILTGSDIVIVTHLLARRSEARREILQARGALLAARENGTEGGAGRRRGAGNAGTGTADSTVMQAPQPPRPPQQDAADNAETAERAMPHAGLLSARAGLALGEPSLGPGSMRRSTRGSVDVDLLGAGFAAGSNGIVVPRPGVLEDRYAMLAVDVWEDGRVSAVQIERSSGLAELDQAARLGARGWTSAAKVPKGGERRRVRVDFRTAAAYPVGSTPPPPALNAEQALTASLYEVATRRPPRYPPGMRANPAEGRVELSMMMSAQGRVLEVSVAVSSGNPALDRAARTAALTWHVTPPENAGNEPVRVRIPVYFNPD